MIYNYFKVAARNIVKRKLYSFINAFGLSIGIAFCVLIFLFIRDERSFDKFHINKDRIYRLEGKSYNSFSENPDEPFDTFAWLQTGMLNALKAEVPEIEMGSRFSASSGIISANDKVFTEEIVYVDADFFRMFSFELIKGNPEKLFQNKSEIVLTPAVAEKYFGNEDPIGKTMSLQSGDGSELTFHVVGIILPAPANSSLEFQILLPQENRPDYERNMTRFGNFNTPQFVQLAPGADLARMKNNVDKVTDRLMADSFKRRRDRATKPIPADVKLFELLFTNLGDIHLRKEISWAKVSDPQYSLILGGIALLILVIACINYVSLALTTSTARRTEVGIRKVVGAQKNQLVYQFGLESVVLALISMVIGIVLAVLFLPAFNLFTKKGITLDLITIAQLVGVSFIITIIVGVLAGSYPALFLSGFKPATVLKGRFTSKLQAGFTRPLVVLQFALSAFLIISSVIMYRQMQFVTTIDLGYNKDQVIVVPTQYGWTDASDKLVARFREASGKEPSIMSVAGTTSSFNQG